LTFGFENEIVYNIDRSSDKFNNRIGNFMLSNPYLYLKEEGSNDGVELNSHPFNWNWFQTLMKDSGKENFIDELSNLSTPRKFYIDNNCGFHIHLSRKFFSKKHLVKMVKFFYSKEHTKFLLKISKRTRCSFNEWTNNKIPTHQKCINSYYCDYKDIPYTFDQIASFGSWKFDGEMGEKCSILNLCPKKTIEIRLFKGTTNPKLFHAYLEFALAISLFTRDTAYDKITVKNFKKYVKINLNNYKNLARLIKNPRSLKV
jgi:hypothetical protein